MFPGFLVIDLNYFSFLKENKFLYVLLSLPCRIFLCKYLYSWYWVTAENHCLPPSWTDVWKQNYIACNLRNLEVSYNSRPWTWLCVRIIWGSYIPLKYESWLHFKLYCQEIELNWFTTQQYYIEQSCIFSWKDRDVKHYLFAFCHQHV